MKIRCSARAGFYLCLAFGVMLLALGLVAWFALPVIIKQKIASQEAVDSPDATLYQAWAVPDQQAIPDYMQFYMYDTLNAEDVAFKGAKPHLVRKGPYLYNQHRLKWDLSWNADKTQISYKENITYTLFPKRCPPGSDPSFDTLCTFDDRAAITTLNYPMLGLITQIEGMVPGKLMRTVADDAIDLIINAFKERNETLYTTRSVREIIYGYDDPIVLRVIDRLINFLNKVDPKLHVPVVEPKNPLNANNTLIEATRESIVYTGVGDLRNLLAFRKWAGYDEVMDVWNGCDDSVESGLYRYQANMLNGTEGLQFRPFIKKGDTLDVFTDSLFRSSRLLHTGNADESGVHTYRFTIAPEGMMNVTEYPPACAFNGYGRSGVLNMSGVVGAPIYASKPHFLDADPYYLEQVDGIGPPNRSAHDTYLNIEPWTGAVFRAHQRLQINAKVVNHKHIGVLKHIRSEGFYQPIFWVDEKGWMPANLTSALKKQLFVPLKVAQVLQIGATAVGGLLLLLSVVFLVIHRRRVSAAHHVPHLSEATPLVNTPPVERRRYDIPVE